MAPLDSTPRKKEFNVLLTGFGPFAQFKHNPSWLAVSPLHGKTIETESHIISFTAFQMPVTYSAILTLVPPLHARPPVLPASQFPPSPTAPSPPMLHDASSPLPKPMPAPPEGGYDLIMHVGAGRAGNIALEIQGHKTGYRILDVDGLLPPVIEGQNGAFEVPSEAERAEQQRVSIAGRLMVALGIEGEPTRGFGKGYEKFGDPLLGRLDVPALVEHLHTKGLEHVLVSGDAGRYCCDFIYYCSLAESFRGKSQGSSLVQFMHVPALHTPYAVEELTDAVRLTVLWVASQGTKS